MNPLAFFIIIFGFCSAQKNSNQNFVYAPLQNRKEDLSLLRTFWPLKEDAFIGDLQSLLITKWSVIVCESNSVDSTQNSTRSRGILDNDEALDAVKDLRNYVEEISIKGDKGLIRYANVCLSYQSPITNRSVCQFPEMDLVQMLHASIRESQWKAYKKPSLFPIFGDGGIPLGTKMLTGPILGGVELDRASGEIRSIKSIALRYFFKTDPIDESAKFSSEWRLALRDYMINRYRSTAAIDCRYVDEELMTLRLSEKESSRDLVARMLDPTPTATASGYWPDGLSIQLIFSEIPDLSREGEMKRISKAVASFENTPFTFGEEGTICWIRPFLAWRRFLAAQLYGETPESDQSISPFGNFHEDLRIFLQNKNYPVYSQHVVLSEKSDRSIEVKAFRCLITLKNLTDQNQRTRAIQFLRDTASKAQFNISVLAVDFFPPVPLSASSRYQWSVSFYIPVVWLALII